MNAKTYIIPELIIDAKEEKALGDLRDCKFLLPWYNKEKSEANEAGVLCP